MNAQLSMFGPTTSEDTTSVTFSPGSADGATPSASQGGPTTGQSGPDHVPVSRFRERDSEKAMTTNDTSGPLFTASSPSADLQRSLENRLRQNLDLNGSPEYALIWKAVDMPAGPPIYRLRASARRTSGSGFGGWPTTSANDHMPQSPLPEHLNAYRGQPAPRMKEAGWPTPKAQRPEQATTYAGGNPTLAKMAGWATPNTMDRLPSGNLEERKTKGGCSNLKDQTTLIAQTAKRAALNPAFSLWLMGYPTEWAHCAARVMRLSRRSRRSS